MSRSVYARFLRERMWWEQGWRGALAAASGCAVAAVTWVLAVALLRDADPALLFLLYVVFGVMLLAFVATALVTARLAGMARAEVGVVVGAALSVLLVRLLAAAFDISPETTAFWTAAAGTCVAAHALGAVLVAPNPSRPRWAARGLAAVVALSVLPLSEAIATHRDVSDREEQFAALEFPLTTVDLPGYRVTRAGVGMYMPRDLNLSLAPVDETRVHLIAVDISRTPPGDLDCLRIRPLAGLHGRPAERCRDAGPLRWAIDDIGSPAAVIVRGDAMAVLRGPSGSGLDADDLLAAELRPTTARELAEVKRR